MPSEKRALHMRESGYTAVGGGARVLGSDLVDRLRAQVRGTVCLPGEPDYEKSRTIWNAMIDRRPAAILRAAGAADVIQGVDFARTNNLILAIRGGGHNIAGNAVCDGGLMIDLTQMKSVRIDPSGRTARVEPGVTLGEFDREAQAFGLATPVGINSTTGVAGLTLGGGFGWLSRKYGLTIDNLLSADVVTADAKFVHADVNENADLFWAIRGGGGNFGVVTSFEFRLHPVGPQVLSGLIVHPFSRAKELLHAYRDFVAKAPEELTCWVILRKAPPLPFLPQEVHGTEVVVFALCYVGDLDRGRTAVAALQALGHPIADVVGPHPLVGWQTAFDPLLTAGARNYWKSHDFKALSDPAMDVVIDAAGRLPSPDCEIFIGHLGGAINRVPSDATAYPHRDIEFVMNVHTRWADRANDQKCIGWARDLFNKAAPHATGGVYVNFMPEDETGRVQQGAYGANYKRLGTIKAKYDPENIFRMNQNIKPTA
jgi:FAD/FMN-containing dehydrogenase